MIKKLLSSILISLLFITNVYAQDTNVTINVNNNVASITLSGLTKDIHALQLDIVNQNNNNDVNFTPSYNFTYSNIVQKGNTISILIDNGLSLTENGTLNVGTLTFKDKPNLSKNVQIELVNLDENLKGNKTSITATINEGNTDTTTDTTTNNNDTTTETTTNNNDTTTETTTYNNSYNNNNSNNSSGNSSGSSGGGANIGTPSDNKTENITNSNNNQNKPQNKPNGNIDINTMYPVIRQSNFNDITNHWASTPIKYLADRGIINGMNDSTFAPNNNITRAEFITLLAKMDNINVNNHKAQNFIDVPANAWFNPYVDWAAKNGITSGTTATTFAPNDNITREQMAVMIERFANYKNFKLDSNKEKINFKDNTNISSYASSSVSKIQQAGIINGRPDGSFAPKANATRGESAQMIYTMLTIQ